MKRRKSFEEELAAYWESVWIEEDWSDSYRYGEKQSLKKRMAKKKPKTKKERK